MDLTEALRAVIVRRAFVDPNKTKVAVSPCRFAGFGTSPLNEVFGGLLLACGCSQDFLNECLRIETTESELGCGFHLSKWYI